MNLIVVFHNIIEEKSVTRAGIKLGRTQSAISNSLKKLRLAFNDPLFIRSADGLIPTPRAVALAEPISDIISLAENCLADRSAFDPATSKARFRLGAPDRLSLPLILPLLGRLKAKAPGVALDLQTTDREHALELLEADKVDLAIGWFDQPPLRLSSKIVFRENLVCLCRSGHPATTGSCAKSMAEILAYPHVVVSSAGDRKGVFDVILARRGLQRDMAVSVSNFTMVPEFLQESDHIGVFTQSVADVMAKRYGLVSFDLPMEFEKLDHYLVWPKRFDNDLRHMWMREQISFDQVSGEHLDELVQN